MEKRDITAIHELLTLEDGEALLRKVKDGPASGVAIPVREQFITLIQNFITRKLEEKHADTEQKTEQKVLV